MSWWWKAWNSSIGAKTVMAVTGAALLLFVIGHLLGNLQIYLGPDAINGYAKKLKDLPALLWGARAGLLFVLFVHLGSALRLTHLNRAARPQRYRVQKAAAVGLAPRTLLLTGSLVLAFVVYHLLHFTLGATHPEHFQLKDTAGRHDVYSMVILGFSEPAIAISYIVAMVFLGLHLTHGISSAFQTLGLNRPKYQPLLAKAGPALAWLLVAGNISIPLSILLGLVGLPAWEA